MAFSLSFDRRIIRKWSVNMKGAKVRTFWNTVLNCLIANMLVVFAGLINMLQTENQTNGTTR